MVRDECVPFEVDGHTDFAIDSFKIIHIDRAVPKAAMPFIPKSAYTFEETSSTKWPFTTTTYFAPGKPDKFRCEVRSFTSDQGDLVSLPQVFEQFVINRKQLTITSYAFEDEIKALNDSDLLQKCCYSYKLLIIDVQMMGQGMIEKIAGNKMKSLFMNNYKNVVLDY